MSAVELVSLLPVEVRLAIVALLFGGVGTVIASLDSMKTAIRKAAPSQKVVAIDSGIDESQLARKLHDKEPLTVRDIAKLPETVQQHWHLLEILRLGIPNDIEQLIRVSRVVRRLKRSA